MNISPFTDFWKQIKILKKNLSFSAYFYAEMLNHSEIRMF